MRYRMAALAPVSHKDWLMGLCAHLGSNDRIAVFAVPCPEPMGEGANAGFDALMSHPEAPFNGILILASGDTLAWARDAIARAAAAVELVVLVTRGLRPTIVRELLGHGAHDFVAWDCGRDEARLRLGRLLSASNSRRAVRAPTPTAVNPPRHAKLAGLIGESPAFVEQLERVPRVADCDAGVLILGETGTGKDLFAQAVHYLSPRASHPCVAVNCGALPAELVEAELFGHARGAFTSAHENRFGLVAQAQGGTLFLDEVDSLPPFAQVKLLRFLQDKEYRPVGTSHVQHADVRIVAASNVDLATLCERGAFRVDLFYRLNVLTLQLPALRDRGDDAQALAEHFVRSFARRFDRPVSGLNMSARTLISDYAWPGNVRELEHAIERGVLMSQEDQLSADDLGLPTDSAAARGADGASTIESYRDAKARAVEQFERRYIEGALASCHGNITHAANAVSKNRRAFWQLMRKHGIDSSRYRDDRDWDPQG